MIAVIGGVRTTVEVRMAMPQRDIDKQRKQDEAALLAAGIDMNEMGKGASAKEESAEDARFRQYYEQKMREQASDNYWDEVGLGVKDFGGYSPIGTGNDAKIKVINTGCSFNVAKYLGSKISVEAKEKKMISSDEKPVFISIVGDDALGLAAKCELEAAGVDVSQVDVVEGTTPISVEIHNPMGDLDFARDELKIYEAFTPAFIASKSEVLDSAEAIFLDGSLPAETLDFISAQYSSKSKIFFDPGSVQGGLAFCHSSMKAECVMPGRMESEAMSGLQVLGMDALMEAGEHFEARGVAKTVITLKGGGLYYKEGAKAGIIKPEKMLSFVDTKGAGDVISAELIYGLAAGRDLEAAAQEAMACAAGYIETRNK